VIGKRLGDYSLVSLIATGGMARIYEGVDVRLGRHVAVKVLELDGREEVDDDTLPARFEREARAVAKLDHPNIISIYQYGETQGVLFLAMPLIRGRDLAQEFTAARRAGHRMDIKRGLRLLGQIASALDYAHSNGIIHRDVKPSNILIDGNDRAYLTDFGLVFQPQGDPTLGTAFGTPRYISPEQAIASDQATAKSDLYSLAIILYEMLTGQTPFTGTSAMEIALAHVNDTPPAPRSLNPEIPEAAEREILRALSKSPESRQATASELIDAVKAAIDPGGMAQTRMSSPTLAFTPDDAQLSTTLDQPPVEPAEPTQRRSPLIRILLALVVITLVGAEILSLVLNNAGGTLAPEPDATLVIAESELDFLPVAVHYSSNEFNLINTSSSPIDLRGIVFQSGDVIFSLDSLRRNSLPAGMCIRILQDGLTSRLPEGCREVLTQTFFADTSRFFWLSEFTVKRSDNLTATCAGNTGRGSLTCALALPMVRDPGV